MYFFCVAYFGSAVAIAGDEPLWKNCYTLPVKSKHKLRGNMQNNNKNIGIYSWLHCLKQQYRELKIKFDKSVQAWSGRWSDWRILIFQILALLSILVLFHTPHCRTTDGREGEVDGEWRHPRGNCCKCFCIVLSPEATVPTILSPRPSRAQFLGGWLVVSSFIRVYLIHCPRLWATEQHLNVNLASKLLTIVF